MLKILSQGEFRKFDGILNQGGSDTLLITFTDNTILKCTPDHRLMSCGMWVSACLLDIGDELSTGKIIKSIEDGEFEPTFDIFNVEDTHSYYSNGCESHNCSLLYIDECAIIPNTIADEFFASTYPTISSGTQTKIIITSTPKGYNHFWKFWSEAETGKNGFVPCRAEWHEHPNHDKKWYDEQFALLGELKFNQEVLMNFLGSSATLINAQTISNMFTKNVIYSKDGLDVLVSPIKGHSYVMTVDPSKGVGGDSSCFSVIDITCLPYVQVAKYKNNIISPMLFPNVIHKVASEYNEAFVLIEINVVEQIAHILYHEIGYENILMISRSNKGQIISGGFGQNSRMGLQMDRKVKSIGCNNLKILIDEGKLLVHDADTINEISTFIDNGKGSYAADDGYNDDLVMTLVMFGWLTTQSYFKDINMIDIRTRIYEERMQAIDDEILPIGFLCDGNDEVDHEMSAFLMH